MNLFLILGVTLCVTACNPFGFARPTSEKIVKAGWADNVPRQMPEPLYCYRTLGEHMCYDAPLVDGEERLAGRYDPYEPLPEKKPWEIWYPR